MLHFPTLPAHPISCDLKKWNGREGLLLLIFLQGMGHVFLLFCIFGHFLVNATLKWHIEISLNFTFLAIELFCFPFKFLTCSYVLCHMVSSWSFEGIILSFLCQVQSNLQSKNNLAPPLRWYFSEESTWCPVYPLLLVRMQTILAPYEFRELFSSGPFCHLVLIYPTHGGSLFSQRLKGIPLPISRTFPLCSFLSGNLSSKF